MRPCLRLAPVLLLFASLSALLWPRGAQTVPLYAARTGLRCQNCHFDPNGGGPRNDFGFAFARNRHSLDVEDTTSQWHDLDVVNRLGERAPVYAGLNHRLLLLGNSAFEEDSLDRLGFFNMENAIHLAFQPHHRLALVHTRDGATSREAFGWIGGFPLEAYLKAGSFRNPFGLRMDDHTVATRNGFLDFYPFPGPRSFLPYDPRQTDQGIEIGAGGAGLYGQIALTNGASFLFGGPPFGPNPFAETKAVKLGYASSFFHGGLSLYDDYQKTTYTLVDPDPIRRFTRWGSFGMTHWRTVALLGEIAAGTDVARSGARRNLLAGFLEADYAPVRSLNFRIRYDYMNLHRDDAEIAPGISFRELHTHHRYALEGEYVPVPFAELRGTLRFIEHELDRDPSGIRIPDERQAYLQFHFSY